jgi:two-component system sensor histidine kinase KdpD
MVAFRQTSGGRRITKDFGLDHAPVRADASLLHQIILNVLENAAVHTPAEAHIHVSVVKEGSDVVIRVDDDGPGISSEESERIFERFRQGATAAARQYGSGLGLSIARGFARAVAGDVSACPRPDGAPGSRFAIRLPVEGSSR